MRLRSWPDETATDRIVDTEEYYDKLINGEEDSPRGAKRKLDEPDHNDGRQVKMARREEGAMHWGAPGGYPGMPGMPYGYPLHMMPNGAHPGHPYPMYSMTPKPPLPASSNASYYRHPAPSPAPPFTSQSSAGTSRNTPSQNSDSESSQDTTPQGTIVTVTESGSTLNTAKKKKKTPVNGLEKRVSFAEQVSERSLSPAPAPVPVPMPAPIVESEQKSERKKSAAEEYNPIVKGSLNGMFLFLPPC